MIERTQEDKDRFSADMERIQKKLTQQEAGLANARLIAAAPELLEACKIALPLVHGYLISMGGTHAERIMSQIESAIAKAEGK